MKTEKIQREQINTRSGRFSHRIGSTVYTVSVYSKEGSSERLEEKIFRLIKRDLGFGPEYVVNENKSLKSQENHVKMAMPQTDWLPERDIV